MSEGIERNGHPPLAEVAAVFLRHSLNRFRDYRSRPAHGKKLSTTPGMRSAAERAILILVVALARAPAGFRACGGRS
jgi:hypothetical protein